MQNILDRKKW